VEDYSSTPEPTRDAAPVVLDGKTQVLGVDYKVAGILCYVPICLINVIASVVFLSTEPKSNTFVRFHAWQSIILAVATIAFGIVTTIVSAILGVIPVIGVLVGGLLSLLSFGVWVFYIGVSIWLIACASKGETKSLPYIGEIARQRMES
jgi:uncharacterized membrane protein